MPRRESEAVKRERRELKRKIGRIRTKSNRAAKRGDSTGSKLYDDLARAHYLLKPPRVF